jgi:hypothetical protein
MRSLSAANPVQPKETGSGPGKARANILNIVTPDVFAVAVGGKEVWQLLNAILSVMIGLGLLYYLLGVSALLGVAAITLASPASYWVATATYRE